MISKEQEKIFHCQQCGICCRWTGHVLLTGDDIARLATATGLSEEEFIERHTILAANRRQLSLAEYPDGRCIFLEEGRCAFYEARPDQCRNFPHTWRVAEGCPALEEMDKNKLSVESSYGFPDNRAFIEPCK